MVPHDKTFHLQQQFIAASFDLHTWECRLTILNDMFLHQEPKRSPEENVNFPLGVPLKTLSPFWNLHSDPD